MTAADIKPVDISDLDMAFPAHVSHLMPKYEDIPAEFKRFDGTHWAIKLFSDMFYHGIDASRLMPKDGIAKGMALRHVRCIAGSFEPKHEHKTAACAYLFSLWFKPESKWDKLPKKGSAK